MPFDTQPGNVPIPITAHTVTNCACGHTDESHEAVATSVGSEQTELIVCYGCDADDV